MRAVEIRPAVPGDAPGIRRVHQRAFGGRPNEADLVDALLAAGQAPISLVATVDGQVAAHVLFSVVTIQPDSDSGEVSSKWGAVGLAPLAVLPEYQNQGIGTRVAGAGLTACREASYAAVVVLGHPRFYSRLGFRRARDFGLSNEYGADEAFQAIVLDESAWAGPTGTVKFRPEFAATGC